MRMSFYPRLAISGIKKNSKLYIPYILSSIGIIMMFYILAAVSSSDLLSQMKSGTTLAFILALGRYVIAVFAVVFLFYTNSFLIKRRHKEFGLFNILGMDKKGIRKIVFWESLIVSSISIAAGLILGIIFYKLAELGLTKAIHGTASYDLFVSADSILLTLLIFAVIYGLILVKTVIRVNKTKPIELLRSESRGEKPPKANPILAIIGLLLLAGAYCISVTISDPVSAVALFFVAVLMVIVATYLLFMTGSVAFCRLLQKKKSFYYNKKNYVSVSSMTFRMKRNGAGLASICILSTMVLVMISSSASLYFGENETLASKYPRDNKISVFLYEINDMKDETTDIIDRSYDEAFRENNASAKDVLSYRYAEITAISTKNGFDIHSENYNEGFSLNTSAVRCFEFMSVADVNRLLNTSYKLEAGQAIIKTNRCRYNEKQITIEGLTLDVVGVADEFPAISDSVSSLFPTICVIIPDYETLAPLADVKYKDSPYLDMRYYYAYNIDGDENTGYDVLCSMTEKLRGIFTSVSYNYSCLSRERDDFFATYGGLFFIGIILSILFVFAAAMIIYYKQISEGFEDKSRFDIMQKVGMTKEEIKKSIESQTVTVFFAPLLAAGLHLGFAFPMVWKLLLLFGLVNIGYVILVTAASFVLFGLLYVIIYWITAKAYYSIVSKNSMERRAY